MIVPRFPARSSPDHGLRKDALVGHGVGVEESPQPSILDRIADGICRRAFSSPEAIAYEATIAPALARTVTPTIRSHFHGGRILDVGCGGGRIAASLGDLGASSIVGVDPSASQTKTFRRRALGHPASSVVRAGAEALPFADGSFDYLFSSCAWKHWPDAHMGLAECCRVTRSGGTLLIIEIDGSSTRSTFERFARQTRFPPGTRWAYLGFAMRTVVGVAPDPDVFARSFDGLPVQPPQITQIGDSPFLIALTTVL